MKMMLYASYVACGLCAAGIGWHLFERPLLKPVGSIVALSFCAVLWFVH